VPPSHETTKGSAVVDLTTELTWNGEGLLFDGRSARGCVRLSGTGDEPGAGPAPSELLLLAVGGCTAMDVVSILRKMRQPLEGLEVEVRGTKADEHPRRFLAIEVLYRLRGDLSEHRVRRAIELSETRYCAMEATLRGCVELSSRYVIER
jgi:putative redox protein